MSIVISIVASGDNHDRSDDNVVIVILEARSLYTVEVKTIYICVNYKILKYILYLINSMKLPYTTNFYSSTLTLRLEFV